MARRRRGQPKPKAVHYELIARDSVIGHPMYALLDELVDAHHGDLRDARIALAWNLAWRPDVDGRVTLGKCRKASDLDRELAAFDFVILLRRMFWLNDQVTPQQRRALLDHELCHAARKYEQNGEPSFDERGRPVYRLRHHDIEEFTDVVKRHGIWSSDLEALAKVIRRDAERPFKPCEQCKDSPGWVSVVDLAGVGRVERCACWVRWNENRTELQAEAATA